MSLNAVQQKIAGYLTGLTSKGFTTPISAQVLQPVATWAKVTAPLVFVWGGAATETRLTIPRGPGWKHDAHTISLWLFALDLAADPNRAWRFPVLIDTVLAAMRGASPMPAALTDPQTFKTSQLLNLGEEMTWEYDIDRTLADQRMIRHVCRIDVSVLEEFNA